MTTDPDQTSDTAEATEAPSPVPDAEAEAEAPLSEGPEADATPESEAAAPEAAPPKKGRKTAQEQALARREAKLDAVSEQIEKGGLVIRQMTDEERAKYPPRPTPVKRPGPRGR